MLKRRISFFKLRSSDTQRTLQGARNVIENEIQGPWKLLEYRAMHKKLKQVSFRHYFWKKGKWEYIKWFHLAESNNNLRHYLEALYYVT